MGSTISGGSTAVVASETGVSGATRPVALSSGEGAMTTAIGARRGPPGVWRVGVIGAGVLAVLALGGCFDGLLTPPRRPRFLSFDLSTETWSAYRVYVHGAPFQVGQEDGVRTCRLLHAGGCP